MTLETAGKWVGLIGGSVGLIATVVAGIFVVFQYFATREQLRIVDCAHYLKLEKVEAEQTAKVLAELYISQRSKAARAEIDHKADPKNAEKLVEYRTSVEDQNTTLERIKSAQSRAKKASEEIASCGHKGRENFRA